jgi:TolA-binding protein
MCALVLVAVLVCGMVWAQEEPQTYWQKGNKAYHEAHMLERDRNYDEAMKAYEAMAEAYPKHEYADRALLSAARCAGRTRQYGKQAALAEKALKMNPKGDQAPGAKWELANALVRKDEPEHARAAKMLEQAATEYSGWSTKEHALLTAMSWYSHVGDHAAVVRAADTYLNTLPTRGNRFVQALEMKVRALMELAKADEAAEVIEGAKDMLSGGGELGRLYRRCADALYNGKEFKKAAGFYEKAAGYPVYDSASWCLFRVSETLSRVKPMDAEAVIQSYRQFVQTYPTDPRSHEALWRVSQLYRNNVKDRQKEIETYQEFMRKYPKSIYMPRILWHMGDAYRALKQVNDMKAICLQIVEKYPHSGYADDAMWRMAEQYMREKETEKARQMLERLVKEKPGYRYADNAARALENL